MGKRVTLKDVAAAAGVSAPTASRVLSGTARNVDPELAERVRQAQTSLGYRVNAAARALRIQSTGSIGLAVPGISNAYFSELVSAFSRHLDAEGRRLITFDTNESVDSEARQLADMDRVLVDAILVVPVDYCDSAAALNTLAAGHKVVQVDRVASNVDLPAVHLDNAAGVGLLMDHLRSLGRERILMVDAQPRSFASRERAAAFRNLSGIEDSVLQMDTFSVSSGTQAAAAVLALPAQEQPDAILCTADVIALGMLTAFQHAGRRIPDDYAMATFDGTYLSEISSPALTTLASPAEKMVRAALDLIDGTRSEHLVQISPQLVVRGSTRGL